MDRVVDKAFGKYGIVELMATNLVQIYKAVDTTINRMVTLKVLAGIQAWEREITKSFLEEARIEASLRHPNIIDIYEVGLVDGSHYVAMEYIVGPTLHQLITKEGPLTLDKAMRIIEQIASALDYAHEQGIVHGDVKPSNIIVGAGEHVTVTDFGAITAGEDERLVRTGVILGTLEYTSPERLRGSRLDKSGDIYSLGMVLYEMLTGKPPFSGSDARQVMDRHLHETPRHLRSLRPDLPQQVEKVMNRALAKDPKDRFASAGELASALSKSIGRP